MNNLCSCGNKTERQFHWSNEWDVKETFGKVNVMLTRNKSIWLVQNAGNKWGLVGGGIEKGESPKKAAIRETREETGLNIHPSKFKLIKQQTFNMKPIYWFHIELSENCMPRLTNESINEISGCGWFCPLCCNKFKLNRFGKEVLNTNSHLYQKFIAIN